MKQRLLWMLALMLTFVCSHQVYADELVAPVEPEWEATPTTLQSGKVYYLYCPANERYLCDYRASNGSYGGYNKYSGGSKDFTIAKAVILKQEENGWTMQNVQSGEYISECSRDINNGYERDRSLELQGVGIRGYWSITSAVTDDCYNIQRATLNPYYDVNKFFAYPANYSSTSNYFIYTDQPYSTSCDWQLIDAEVRERYLATQKLYDAIRVAQGMDAYIPYYTKMYQEKDNHTILEIYTAAKDLEKAVQNMESDIIDAGNEFPLLIESTAGSWEASADNGFKAIKSTFYNSTPHAISAIFKVERDAVFYYHTYTSQEQSIINVFVDGVLVRTLEGIETTRSGRYFEELSAGEHHIEIRYTCTSTTHGGTAYIGYIGVMDMNQITVSLLEPGSLGTEVLYNVDGLKDVKNLKIIGKMNDDDWDKIAMMNRLVTVDLSEAVIATVPSEKFKGYVHRVILPEGLKTIDGLAFWLSYVEYVNIPTTVETIGTAAFCRTSIKEIVLPNSVTSMGTDVFSYCYRLREVVLPSSLGTVSSSAFQGCSALTHCTLSEGIENIGEYAFYGCYNLRQSFPESLKTIGGYAYYAYDSYQNPRGCISCETDSVLTIPANVTTIGNHAFYRNYGFNKIVLKGGTSIGREAFAQCYNLKDVIIEKAQTIGENAFYNCDCLETIELPVDFYHITDRYIFRSCPNVNKIILRSPTVVSRYEPGDNNKYGLECDLNKVDLVVPDYLINQYKMDSYWYNYKTISGFSTADIQDWRINMPLVLDSRGRFLGTPNITINGSSSDKPSLKINGDAPMAINNLYFNGYYSNTYYNYPGQILSNCNNITVTGDVQTELWSKAKYWYFYSLPFDVKISEITHSADNVQKAVRYYDGANRAANGASGSWKNFDADAVIPAGTGFIMQTNVDTWNYFHALDNESKQQCVSNKEFVTTLAVNDSENASNKGWNLVGNPWQCYYNDHALNFTGPITVWSVGNKTYTAYSITDDNYAIRPNEAFFVQCPNEQFNTIGFPTNGRQLTNVIERQYASNARVAANARRQLVDVIISNGENEDQTRVVLNEQASMDYELTCDAAKMMSMDASVPQVFTTDALGTQYAINERPVGTGIISLGFMAPADDTYTLSLGRNNADEVILVDYESGTEQSIVGAEYRFMARAGMNEGRFALKFTAGAATGIHNVENVDKTPSTMYNLAGQRIFNEVHGVSIVNGKKVVNQ